MPVGATMRPIQPGHFCYSQSGSSAQVTWTKPSLLLCVCVCMYTHVQYVFDCVKKLRVKEWDTVVRRSKRTCLNLCDQESKQMEKVRECASQGQDSVIVTGPPRLTDRTHKQPPFTSVCFIRE